MDVEDPRRLRLPQTHLSTLDHLRHYGMLPGQAVSKVTDAEADDQHVVLCVHQRFGVGLTSPYFGTLSETIKKKFNREIVHPLRNQILNFNHCSKNSEARYFSNTARTTDNNCSKKFTGSFESAFQIARAHSPYLFWFEFGSKIRAKYLTISSNHN